jgi:hypothetical protein
MRRSTFVLLPALITLPALVFAACGGAESTSEPTAAPTAAPTSAPTAAPTASPSSAPASATVSPSAGPQIDEALIGVWVSDKGIEVEFTADGFFILRYGGQETRTACTTKAGKAYYVDFEANAQGVKPSMETPYEVAADTLTWSSGASQVVFTRKS